MKVAQLCPTLCDPMDYAAPGILQARTQEWVAYPFPSPADLPNPGIKPGSPALQVDSLPTELSGKPSGGVASGYMGAGTVSGGYTVLERRVMESRYPTSKLRETQVRHRH